MYDVVSTRADEEGVSPERLTRKLCQRESHRHYHLTTQHQQEVEQIPERHHTMDGRERGDPERVQHDVLKEGRQSPIGYENHPIYKGFNTKIYCKLLPAIPQPRVAKSLFSFWAPARLTHPYFIPPQQLQNPSNAHTFILVHCQNPEP